MTPLERELPPTLAQFSRDVRRRLGQVEKRIHAAEVSTRRSFTRVLREASHQLGHFEAQGERRWRKLTAQARKDALRVLRRLERALEPPKPKRTAKKKSARKGVRRTTRSEASGSGI